MMTKEEAWKKAKSYLYDALDGEEADEIIKTLEQKPCEDVERSKIYKAFSEIEKLVTVSMRVAPWEDNYRSGLREAMVIIERNMGG